MWLNLEAGVAKQLNRRPGVHIVVPHPHHARFHGSRSLIVEAADSLLPEAAIEDLPALARAELAAGWSGPLREAIATTDSDDPGLIRLRDELVAEIGGTADAVGAMTLTDQVYLGRLVQDAVPPVVTAGCLLWYGHWRAGCGGPNLDVAAEMGRLAQDWNDRPAVRSDLDTAMRDLARRTVGPAARDLIAGAI